MSSVISNGVTVAVGIDTARYGHHVTFLDQDRRPAADPLTVTENEAGYRLLRERLEQLEQRFPEVQFRVRIDAAGQYATNLERFLRRLPQKTEVSLGEPKRNKDYHAAMSPKKANDRTESHAMARFAVAESPAGTPDIPDEFFLLRETVSRLEGTTKDVTRAVNRLHNVLARVFPELSTIVADLQYKWVLKLLDKYPTPQRIAAARSLEEIPYLKSEVAQSIKAAARITVGSLTGPVAEELVREGVCQLRHALDTKKRLETLLENCFRDLPQTGHVHVVSIPGIGVKTAAVLVAKIIDIGRFETPENLVGYFGVFPAESSSGVDKHGRAFPAGTLHMSTKGSDIVRSYLWNAAKTAIKSNPAVRDLYARLRARGTRGDVALGHCMRKLLHQVFGVWVSNRPFDENLAQSRRNAESSKADEQPAIAGEEKEAVAGHKRDYPQRKVVTATKSTVTQPSRPRQASKGTIDYAYLREQITIAQVLDHLGLADGLRGGPVEQRGPCPFHSPSRRNSKTFNVNLDKHLFHCTHPTCDVGGNALDLWKLAKGLPVYEAALDLAETFHLELQRTEKRQPVNHRKQKR